MVAPTARLEDCIHQVQRPAERVSPPVARGPIPITPTGTPPMAAGMGPGPSPAHYNAGGVGTRPREGTPRP